MKAQGKTVAGSAIVLTAERNYYTRAAPVATATTTLVAGIDEAARQTTTRAVLDAIRERAELALARA